MKMENESIKQLKENQGHIVTIQEETLKRVKELRETIVQLAHAVGPYIPKGSDLEKKVYKLAKEE